MSDSRDSADPGNAGGNTSSGAGAGAGEGDTVRTAPRSFRDSAEDFLPEALGGLVAAHPDAVWHDAGFLARRSGPTTVDGAPAVAVVSGGGSGHEPMHAGFVGDGMLAAACPGLLFTSPNAVQVTEATRWADQGRGVLHVVKNYTGDVMNFHVARQSLADVETEVVIVDDDVATDVAARDRGEGDGGGDGDNGRDSEGPGRRGTAATILVEKIAGAAARRGDDLATVARIARSVADNSRSMAVSLAPGHLPTSGRDTFDLPDGEMEVGVGIHGERGVDRVAAAGASEICSRLLDAITSALELGEGDEVVCLVNGLGGTTALELDLLFGRAATWLGERGIRVRRSLVGTFVTSVNMVGASITLTRVEPGFLELLDAETAAPAWPRALGGELDPGRPVVPARIAFDDELSSGGETPPGEENAWLGGFVERVRGAVDELTELDRLAGDGDFGTNMDAALGDIALPLRGEAAGLADALSHRFLVRSGGTSGAVLGTVFRELAAGLRNGSGAEGLAVGLENAASGVMDLGGAREGDDTLLDALAPAARAAREAAGRGEGMDAALTAAYDAAERGALATRELVARKGRASYLGEASRGVPDPGAIVVAWLFGGSGRVADFTGER